jgi:hypothetical protein
LNELDIAVGLSAQGRFVEALTALEKITPDTNSKNAKLVLRAELLERVGRIGQSRVLLDELERSRTASMGERSSCEFVRGRID